MKDVESCVEFIFGIRFFVAVRESGFFGDSLPKMPPKCTRNGPPKWAHRIAPNEPKPFVSRGFATFLTIFATIAPVLLLLLLLRTVSKDMAFIMTVATGQIDPTSLAQSNR